MDGPPSQSLGVDPVDRDAMKRPPRPKNAPIITQRLMFRVIFSASMIILGVLFVLARELGDGSDLARDQTMVRDALDSTPSRVLELEADEHTSQTFTSFVFLDLASALQNRGLNVPLLQGNINKMLLLAVSVSFLVQLSLVYLPFLQSVFQTQALSMRDLTVLLLLGGCSMSIHEWRRRWERRTAQEEAWSSAQAV